MKSAIELVAALLGIAYFVRDAGRWVAQVIKRRRRARNLSL